MTKVNSLFYGKNLFIHIGTHKTGSTSIQKFLEGNINFINKHGYCLLKTKYDHATMNCSLYDKNLVKKLRLELISTIKKNCSIQNFILSSECFSGNPKTGYLNSNIVFRMLCDAFEGINIKILILFRRQDSFIESLYTQFIQEGHSFSFNKFLTNFNHPDSLNYTRIVRELIHYFSLENVQIGCYYNWIKIGLVRKFCNITNIPFLENYEDNIYNKSYSLFALNVARNCNKYLDNYNKHHLRLVLQEHLPKESSFMGNLFSDEERLEFLKRFKNDNIILFKQFNFSKKFIKFENFNHLKKDSNEFITFLDVSKIICSIFDLHNHNSLKFYFILIFKKTFFFAIIRKISKFFFTK